MKKNLFIVEGKKNVYSGETTVLATFTDIMLAQIFRDAYEKTFGITVRIVELKH